MKKYTMSFLSVIFLFLILLIPISANANGLESKVYNYNSSDVVNGYYEKFKFQMEEVKNYLDSYKNDYYYVIYFQSTSVRVYLYEKTDNFRFIFRLDDTGYGFNYGPTNNFKINKLDFGFDLGNFETNFNTFKNKLENNNFDETYNGGSSSSTYKDGLTRDTTARIYYTNYDNFILSEDSIYNLNINGDILIKPGEKVPTYYDLIHISYEHDIELTLNDYNYFYLKFRGIGDYEFFYNQSVTSLDSVIYEMYLNDNLIKHHEFVSGGNYSLSYFFENSTDTDIYTFILPIYKLNLTEEEIYNLKFTVPGLIEYGTNEYKYIFKNDNWVLVDSERSDVTDLLKPGANIPDEIISSGTSNNTLTNNSLNQFMWPYSLFARNGGNIKNLSLTGSYSSTSSFNQEDFKTDLIINYGEEKYKININNCISVGNCNLTKFEQDMIKNILFDRNVENSSYYLDFSVIPQKDMILSGSDQFNFGISINFNSSVELTINSMLLAINELSNNYYNAYFKLYDSSGQVHTIYKTTLDNSYIGVNQFQLDSRTADIYRVDLMFVYNHTMSDISKSDKYTLKFSEFNIFANTELIHIYSSDTNITYLTCNWYDVFCHGQNLFTWLTHEAPIAKDFWKVFLYFINIFDLLWVIVTYILMPFDIIPPFFDIPMSTLLPILVLAVYFIKKIWFGGDSDD